MGKNGYCTKNKENRTSYLFKLTDRNIHIGSILKHQVLVNNIVGLLWKKLCNVVPFDISLCEQHSQLFQTSLCYSHYFFLDIISKLFAIQEEVSYKVDTTG